jgi:ABC-type Fe3+/spermidine/putrescine transport system ATPase subunit
MRGALSVRGLTKAYDGLPAVADVSLEVSPGEFVTLLGPSGCGKTTLLRLIAGFETPDGGRVTLSGHDVTDLPPHRRPVNTVFQHYALFPHRTVAGNVAFGLEVAGCSRDEASSRVARALDLVRLVGLGERRIDQISGGQKQRVALARALVLEPEVLLLDEPLAALDLKLRKEMQVEIKRLHEAMGTTFVFVTHDQDEALVMSDRIAVMNQGRIEQVGSPKHLYERPRTCFVADFLAVKNVLEAEVVAVDAEGALLRACGLSLRAGRGDYQEGARVWIGIRPERLSFVPGFIPGSSPPTTTNVLAGILDDEIYLGDRTDWRVRVGEVLLTVAEPSASARGRRRGDAVTVSFAEDALLRLEEGPAVSGAGSWSVPGTLPNIEVREP